MIIKQAECFSYNFKILNILGFYWRNENWYRIYRFIMVGIFWAPIVLLEIVSASISITNLRVLVMILFLLVSHLATTMKFSSLIANKKTIIEIMDALNGPDYNFFAMNHENLIRQAMRHVNRASLFFFYSARFCVASIALAWYFDKQDQNLIQQTMVVHSTNETLISKSLIINSWIPYDYNETPIYELTNCIQLLNIIYICEGTVAVDTLVSGLIHLTAVQFEILSKEFQKLGYGSKPCEQKLEHLKKCVRYHLLILENLKKVQKFCNAPMLAQVLETSFLICICVLFLQMSNQSIFIYSKGLSFLFCIIFEISLYCHYGNQVIAQSDSLPTAVYLSNFHQYKCDCHVQGFPTDNFTTADTIQENIGRHYRLWNHRFHRINSNSIPIAAGSSSFAGAVVETEQLCRDETESEVGSASIQRLQRVHRKQFQQNILFIMCRVTKTTYLTTGKLFILSYETLVAILKSGYSYYAVLNSVQE